MKRLKISVVFLALLAAGWTLAGRGKAAPTEGPGTGITGYGKYRFKLLYTVDHLPAEARNVIKGAHGGFAVDLSPGKGEIYFGLKGAGIVQISSDLKTTRMLDTAPEMKNTNLHNASIWHAADGSSFLEFPSNEAGAVFTTTTDGKLLNTLHTPERGVDLGTQTANDYFAGAGNFVPTDVDQLGGWLYITTGYSNLDMVLTARVLSTNPFRATWNDFSFGGKGTDHGQFMTGHGITVPPGLKRLDIADRPNSRIERFTRYGQYLSTLRTPLGSLPCDIYYLDNYAVIGALDGPNRSKGAPIYLYENDKLVSTLMVKEDLGLPNFKHVHNAVLREINNKLYVIAQAWNPGDFAILEQVTD